MKKYVKLAACFVCALIASAQLGSAQSSPSAYVYLLNSLTGNAVELDGYSADSNGSLTLLLGSPFWTGATMDGWGLAHTAHWLFASDGVSIYSFSIASNGSLKEVSSINAQQYTGNDNGETVGILTLDHTGSTLYASMGDGTGDNQILFFQKGSSGDLTYFGTTEVNNEYGVLNFLGNNQYAYGSGCFQAEGHFYGFSRASDGSLTSFSPSMQDPTNPNGDYCDDLSAADPINHLAVSMYAENFNPYSLGPPAYLAVYTADSSGNLSTNSTSQNMPSAAVGTTQDIKISPAGNLLSIAGTSGLQVFHFNGSNPITPYTGLIAAHNIRGLAWDANNHLFAIGSGKVNAFRVTSTGYKQAPGSPYAINAIGLTVLSLSGSTACAPPSTAGVNICSPANGSTDSSPVSVLAAATASSGLHITATRLYVDAKSVYTSSSNTLSTSVSLSSGSHRLDVVGYENDGSAEKASETITVK